MVRVVKVLMMARVVQVVHVVQTVSLDDMLSENIWFLCPKSSNN